MAHENNPMRPANGPDPLGSKDAPSGASSGHSGETGSGTIPSARLSRIGGNDRGNSQPQEGSLTNGLPGPSNEEFQSWITRVRILNQNDAQPGDASRQSEGAKPLSATEKSAPAETTRFLQAASPLVTATTTPPIAANLPTKAVQSSRDWSETAKKALDEMLVTLPEDKPAGWSSPYAHQSPIAPPPVKTVMPLYAKVLLPVMGLALSAYPLYFAAQKGWIPDLFGDAPIEIAAQARVAGQTPAPQIPAPLSNRSQSTTNAGRSGFELAARAPSSPRVAPTARVARTARIAPTPRVTAVDALPAPLTPPTRARATLLRPQTAPIAANPTTQASPAQPRSAQTPGALTGWTTRVSGANSASVPINIENVVAVGPTAVPAKQINAARVKRVNAVRTITARTAATRNANRFANNSVELPNEIRSVGGPVIALQPSSPGVPRSVVTADPLTGQPGPGRLASITPVEPLAVNPARPALPRTVARTATVEDTQALLTRGTDLLKLGDVVSARLFFVLAAKAGDPTGAMAAGRTYDPLYLSRLGVRGIKADPRQALTWYRAARQGGNTASAADILRLESQAGR